MFAPLEDCKKLYGPSGWIDDAEKVWVRKDRTWFVEDARTYINNPESYDEWGAPAYDETYLNRRLSPYVEVPSDVKDACTLAVAMLATNAIQADDRP